MTNFFGIPIAPDNIAELPPDEAHRRLDELDWLDIARRVDSSLDADQLRHLAHNAITERPGDSLLGDRELQAATQRLHAQYQADQANANALLDLWENGGPATVTAAGQPFATRPIEDTELPDCEHCHGTGKNLAGTLGEDRP